jgi:hypothetical protein
VLFKKIVQWFDSSTGIEKRINDSEIILW